MPKRRLRFYIVDPENGVRTINQSRKDIHDWAEQIGRSVLHLSDGPRGFIVLPQGMNRQEAKTFLRQAFEYIDRDLPK